MVYAQSDLSVQIGDNGADCAPGSRYTMVSSTAPVGIGGWYHVVVVFSGVHSFSAFVNGASVALSYSGGSANSMVYGAGSRLRMNSSYACGTTIREKGSIDEVRIYNRALSATEITQLYKQGASKFATSPTTSLTSGLVGYWTLDGKDTPWTSATAATTKDRSGNSNTGTLTNMYQATSTVAGKLGQGLSFDVYDRDTNLYLDTPSRMQLLAPLNLQSVLVLKSGKFSKLKELQSLILRSNFVTDQRNENYVNSARAASPTTVPKITTSDPGMAVCVGSRV
jgi:hypothetical protein